MGDRNSFTGVFTYSSYRMRIGCIRVQEEEESKQQIQRDLTEVIADHSQPPPTSTGGSLSPARPLINYSRRQFAFASPFADHQNVCKK